MKVIHLIVIAVLLSATSAMAKPPSDNTIRQLLAVTQAQNAIKGMNAQLETVIDTITQQALNGKEPSASQKQAISTMKSKMLALGQQELTWSKLEPIYLRLYRESFTEEEVAGMVAFYKTPAGQAFLQKVPPLLQGVMQEMQKMMAGMTPQMRKIQQDFMTEMASAGK